MWLVKGSLACVPSGTPLKGSKLGDTGDQQWVDSSGSVEEVRLQQYPEPHQENAPYLERNSTSQRKASIPPPLLSNDI